MKEAKNNRRDFLQKFGVLSLAAGTGTLLQIKSFAGPKQSIDDKDRLLSLLPSSVFSVLDLDLPELASVRNVLERKGNDEALKVLLKYYRMRFPKPDKPTGNVLSENEKKSVSRAEDLVKHIFQWGPYPPAGYGNNINWAADPAGDIEWVANLYRFQWANDLGNAFKATGDERYARTFIELATDWIKKHPLEKTMDAVHPVYGWDGYPWLDLQTGIRATNICSNLKIFIHAKSFMPDFLGILLASLYDHQVKTEKLPMQKVHNKAIFEQRGFFNVLYTIREYKDRKRWLDLAIDTTSENLLAQTTNDGVQREWCGGYHTGVYRDALEIDGRATALGRTMPDYYRKRVRAMADHIFGIATPELAFPMFGDTARARPKSGNRKTWSLYNVLIEAGEKFNDPKFKALADLNIKNLPVNGSVAFADAGLYAMRNNWTPDQVYMALHCSPPAISTHDTPDNGTFELYAYGRWLMPDSGFYTYGHDKDARAWHRQTKVHPTMTVNGTDTNVIGRQLFWDSKNEQDVLCVENQSYKYFTHRRTVWFAGKDTNLPFFVILDEANGDAKGDLEIHFPMAAGPLNVGDNSFNTTFDDANLLVQVAGKHAISLKQEPGWHAWEYGEREARTSISAVHSGHGPTVFVSILVPYKGRAIPACSLLTDPKTLVSGNERAELQVEVAGKKHTLSRNT